YPRDWQTMVNNCRVLQCFGALNKVAADGMAELTGFLSGDAILDLGPGEMVLQLAGDDAGVAQLPNYLADPAFKGLFDQNPYFDSKRAVAPPKPAPSRMYSRTGLSAVGPPVTAGAISKADPLLSQLLEKARKSKPRRS